MRNKENNNKEVLGPIAAIKKEVEKTKRAPKKIGILTVQSANDCIEDSLNTPDPKTYFYGLIVQYETTVIFASSNVGKSILAIQIAEDIARTEKILDLDLELSAKQFQMRYTDPTTKEVHIFPPNFHRAEIAPELLTDSDIEQEILDSIEEAAKTGIKFFIVDNITFICNDSEKGATAGSFMMKLISLKKKYRLTTIIIAHTPKRRGWEPITLNDLAGSAKLMNFFDAGIALARSARDNNLRYLKQVKVRTGEYKYDADHVIIYDLVKDNAFLHFEYHGYDTEYNHLSTKDPSESIGEIEDILRLEAEGKSRRDIAKTLGMSLGKVQRRLKKAKEQNITLADFKTDKESETVSPVSDVSDAIQTIHPIQSIQQRLPYKDQDDNDEI